MKNSVMNLVAKAFIVFAFVSSSRAQGTGSDICRHIDPSVKTYSMVIGVKFQWYAKCI